MENERVSTRRFSLKKHPSSNNFNTTSYGKDAPFATDATVTTPVLHRAPLHKFPIDHLMEPDFIGNKSDVKTSLKMVKNCNNRSSIQIGGQNDELVVRTHLKMIPNYSNGSRNQRPYGLDTDPVV
jgi:hypothetical protein